MRSKRCAGRRNSAAVLGAAVILGTLLVLATAALAGCGSSGGGGDTAPDFSGATLGGDEVSLAAYRGKPLVLAFMASW